MYVLKSILGPLQNRTHNTLDYMSILSISVLIECISSAGAKGRRIDIERVVKDFNRYEAHVIALLSVSFIRWVRGSPALTQPISSYCNLLNHSSLLYGRYLVYVEQTART